ncbi:Protein slit [Nymphon striatum]|nr:Protein slit [Nymphon striatum]
MRFKPQQISRNRKEGSQRNSIAEEFASESNGKGIDVGSYEEALIEIIRKLAKESTLQYCGNIKDYTPEGETDNDSGEEETEETSAWQIDNNLISCVDDSILRSFKYMEILTMNANNISTLGRDVFEHMKKLRVLRLADNGFKCDCHLSWLARWLRKHPRLALFTKCITPHRLRNKGVAELHDSEFKCNEPFCDYY